MNKLSKIQFMHYRKMNDDILNTIDSHGGATVAILPGENNIVTISISRCNPGDVFDKKLGRAIAAGRIQAYLNGRSSLENKIRTIAITDPLKLKESVARAVQEEMSAQNLY